MWGMAVPEIAEETHEYLTRYFQKQQEWVAYLAECTTKKEFSDSDKKRQAYLAIRWN
jgi:hypothetical protein